MSRESVADAEFEEPKITLDDVKQRALAVRDLAYSEARHATNRALRERATQTALVGVVAVVALTSLAFYLGTRKGRHAPSRTGRV